MVFGAGSLMWWFAPLPVLAGVEESYWITVVSVVVVWCVLLGSLAATGPPCGGVVACGSPRLAARCLLVRGGCPGGVVV